MISVIDSLSAQIGRLEKEVAEWRGIAIRQAEEIINLHDALARVTPVTLVQWIEDLAIGYYGVKIDTQHVITAINFLAGSGFLTVEQFEFYTICQSGGNAFPVAVWEHPIVPMIAHKAALARKGEPFYLSEADYALLHSISAPET